MNNSPDAALLAAYAEYRRLNAALYSLSVDDDGGYEALQAKMPELDKVLFNTAPKTIAGVNAILRRITPALEAERWLDRAIAYEDHETLEERKGELGHPYPQLINCILALTELVRHETTAPTVSREREVVR